MLLALVQGISSRNQPGADDPLPNPYYDAETVLPSFLKLEEKPIEDSFAGSSYYLEGLMHLFVRANFKFQMSLTFPSITHIGFRSFVPEDTWQFFMYRNNGIGTDHDHFLQPPHSWTELRKLADECEGNDLPEILRQFPILYLCFILVLPHRGNSSGLRWISSRLADM